MQIDCLLHDVRVLRRFNGPWIGPVVTEIDRRGSKLFSYHSRENCYGEAERDVHPGNKVNFIPFQCFSPER